MHRKRVLLIQEGMGSADVFVRAARSIDADLVTCRVSEFSASLEGCNVVIYAVDAVHASNLSEFEKALVNADNTAALLVVEPEALSVVRLPAHIMVDFIVPSATEDEIAVRLRRLLWPGEEASSADFISIDSMTINLSTYQVHVGGMPVDFTYLEYALLAFLVTHPGHAYSRDALLRRVWGFDYYGGSRTVDVHVRRVRAKLGTELAARLVTIRGVGYMWDV